MGKSDILQTLGDFTSKENWDQFFTIRGHGDAFEWYAEWPELKDSLISHLPSLSHSSLPPQILVPGCGNSNLSEKLYDIGFRCITNIDFSKVAISDMLRRNVRERPDMRWRVMDMTVMQFMDDTFDSVLDKGGLDALMEPEVGPKLGSQYLSEVKRVTKTGGKFICLTLAESHVLGLLFSKFRFGWKMSIHVIPKKPSTKPNFQTFMVVVEKDECTVCHQIKSSNFSSLDSCGNQTRELVQTLENENRIRQEYSSGADLLFSLEDLQLGAKGDLQKLHQGRRFQFTLGGQGTSIFSYRAVLLDAREQCGPFSYECGVFIVPKTRVHEWLFSSEEGQWMVVDSSKAARLIMVLLDETHSDADMDAIQKDLSPLVKQLAPGKEDHGSQIPFMMASDGIKERNCIFQATSSLTGPIVVEDVIYEHVNGDVSRIFPSRDLIFRRLVFKRTESLVQSEALLTMEGSQKKVSGQMDRKKTRSSSKLKNKGKNRQNKEVSDQMKVYHGFLASSYHTGIISGFILISRYIENVASTGAKVNAVVIGLGAGLLPMFLNACMPFLHIEVVELDPMILNLARDHFDFVEDKDLMVHIADGIQFVREFRSSEAIDSLTAVSDNDQAVCNTASSSVNGTCLSSLEGEKGDKKIDILIIDVDATDSSSGMTCPAADFVEEPFLLAVKDALSEQGLFIVNLVTRSPTVNDMVVSRMKGVFSHIFSLQLEEDVNEVIFALPSEFSLKEDFFDEAALQLEKLLNLNHPEMRQSIIDATKKIRCMK